MKSDRVYLSHIVECLDSIAEYMLGGVETALKDRKTEKATLRELQEMAESTQRLSRASKAAHPQIPWADIAGFRNILVHDYLGLNLDRVRAVLERDLSPLRLAVEALLKTLPPDP